MKSEPDKRSASAYHHDACNIIRMIILHFNSKMGSRKHLQTTDNITYGQPVALGCGAFETVRMREGILGWIDGRSSQVSIAGGKHDLLMG